MNETKLEISAIEAREKAATPGPWCWMLNPADKSVRLSSIIGMQRTVLDVVRWGMSGATVRFNIKDLMHTALECSRIITGREHHSKWAREIDHPDALFIEAARSDIPALLARIRELEAAVRWVPVGEGLPKAAETDYRKGNISKWVQVILPQHDNSELQPAHYSYQLKTWFTTYDMVCQPSHWQYFLCDLLPLPTLPAPDSEPT